MENKIENEPDGDLEVSLVEKNDKKSDSDKEPEIKIVDEKPAKKADVVSDDDGIKKLQENLKASNQARINAEYSAQQAARTANELAERVQRTEIDHISSAIDFAKEAKDTLKRQYAEALKNGDFEAVAELQDRMSDVSAKLVQLESGKTALETRPVQRITPPVDVVDKFTEKLSSKSAEWIRNHPEFVTDKKLNRKMLRAHEDAMDDGISADTSEYFSYIENRLGLNNDDGYEKETHEPQRRSAPAAAPVTRNVMSNGQRAKTVTLSADEREMARLQGMTYEEYGREKLAAINSDPNYRRH